MVSIERKTVLVNGAEGAIGSLLTARLRDAGAIVIGIDVGIAEPALSTALGMSALLNRPDGGPIDILVNLASLSCCRQAAKEPIAQAMAYRAGLIAASMISRALLPTMRTLDDAQIVSVGASFDDWPIDGFEIWSGENAGHKGLTAALTDEVAGSCIRVSYVDAFADISTDERVADRIITTIIGLDGHFAHPTARLVAA